MPCPGSLRTSMLPPNASAWSRTASSPTPRPASPLTALAVEKPGWVRTAVSEPLLRASASVSSEMPRPSSETVTSTMLPRCSARSSRRPRAGLPARSRSSGGSIPWPTALRSRWTSGSERPSRIARSSSVSAPTTTSSTCLPVSPARSRTARGSGVTIDESGSVRMPIAAPLRSSSSRSPRSSSSVTTPWPAWPLAPELVLEPAAMQDGLADEIEQRVDLLGGDADRAALGRGRGRGGRRGRLVRLGRRAVGRAPWRRRARRSARGSARPRPRRGGAARRTSAAGDRCGRRPAPRRGARRRAGPPSRARAR